MVDEVDLPWPSEEIPDQDLLYTRVHRNNMVDGELTAAAFKIHGDGLSTDWAKHCFSVDDTRRRAKSPRDNAVVSFVAGDIRADVRFAVVHTPIRPTADDPVGDRAHVDVRASRDVTKTEFRAKLSDPWTMAIPLDDPA